MIELYRYEVWKSKKIIGYYDTMHQLRGNHLIIPTMSVFKQPYNKQTEYIKFIISSRLLSDNGIDYTIRTIIDANRKSKRQIDILIYGRTTL